MLLWLIQKVHNINILFPACPVSPYARALDSFEYTPGMIKLLVRPEETSSLRVRHDAYVKQGRVVIGYADQIVDDAKNVKVNDEYVMFKAGSTEMSL